VKEAFSKLIAICFIGTFLLAGIAVGRPGIYARIFTDNQELISLTCKVMPVYFLGITIFGIQSSCQSTFLALGQAKVSLFIALLRKVILLIPLALILPKFMGVMGIYRAEPIADIISVITTAVLFFITFRKIMRDMQENK
jgi:Na+-driven multidrug efflux pump